MILLLLLLVVVGVFYIPRIGGSTGASAVACAAQRADVGRRSSSRGGRLPVVFGRIRGEFREHAKDAAADVGVCACCCRGREVEIFCVVVVAISAGGWVVLVLLVLGCGV